MNPIIEKLQTDWRDMSRTQPEPTRTTLWSVFSVGAMAGIKATMKFVPSDKLDYVVAAAVWLANPRPPEAR